MMWPWMWGGSMMGWGMWLWIPLVLDCGWFFFTWLSRYYRHVPYDNVREDPLEVAGMRLARGEITTEEYEKIRETLES